MLIVNSLSSPSTNWDESEDGPGPISTLIKATGVPIDKYSYEAIEQLKDIEARWRVFHRMSEIATFPPGNDSTVTYVRNAPKAKIYPIDVSFPALKDKAERNYLNQLPTSFVLSDEQVDRLRRAAGTILMESPDFQQLLKDAGATAVELPAPKPALAPRPLKGRGPSRRQNFLL